jgi:hypothetical protein
MALRWITERCQCTNDMGYIYGVPVTVFTMLYIPRGRSSADACQCELPSVTAMARVIPRQQAAYMCKFDTVSIR